MKITISDGTDNILDLEVPDDARLAEFGKHKNPLLDMLRKAHARGQKSEPFNEDKAWRSLTGLAVFYFRRGGVKQKTMPTSGRIEDLRDIARALGRARRLASRAMRSDVPDALY